MFFVCFVAVAFVECRAELRVGREGATERKSERRRGVSVQFSYDRNDIHMRNYKSLTVRRMRGVERRASD